MGVSAYRSNSSRRVFTNLPFRRGMVAEQMTVAENVCHTLINFDISGTGDFVKPRPAFVNAIPRSLLQNERLEENTLLFNTGLNRKFLLGFPHMVSEEDFLSDTVEAPIEPLPLTAYSVGEETKTYTKRSGTKRVYLVDVIDGDTIEVVAEEGPSFRVRILGYDAPELDTQGGLAAKDYLIERIIHWAGVGEPDIQSFVAEYGKEGSTPVKNIILEHDIHADAIDSFGRTLTYVHVIANETEEELHLRDVGATMLHDGDSTLLIGEDYLRYDNYAAIAGSPGADTNPEPTPAVQEKEIEEGDFFKKQIYAHPGIIKGLYYYEDYFSADFNPDEDGEEFDYIEILKHEYQDKDIISFECPHASAPWRNMFIFLGRVIKDGEVLYRGHIMIQYDGEDMFIILPTPQITNIGSFDFEDPTRMNYNALLEQPLVFDDFANVAEPPFIRPEFLGAIFYNKLFDITDPPSDLKVFTRFNTIQEAFLRPYISLDESLKTDSEATHFKHVKLYVQDEGRDIVEPITIMDDTEYKDEWYDELDREWNFSRIRGRSIQLRMETLFEKDLTIEFDIAQSNTTEVSINDDMQPADFVGIRVFPIADHFKESIVNKRFRISMRGNTYESEAGLYAFIFTLVEIPEEGPEVSHGAHSKELWGNESSTYVAVENFEYPSVGLRFRVEIRYRYGNETATFNYATGSDPLYLDVEKYYEKWEAVSATQPIITSGERLIDLRDMQENYNLKNATHLAFYDRFLMLYGDHMGSNAIQFSDFDNFNLFPFPTSRIDFDSNIVHAHQHRDALYVFSGKGLYILHSGFRPVDMTKTFAYGGASLRKTEKHAVITSGNEVFYLSEDRGYVIRTNKEIVTEDDVYVMHVTNPIDSVLTDMAAHLRLRLLEGYGIALDESHIFRKELRTHVVNQQMYIVVSSEITDIPHRLMSMFIFDKDYRRWRMYDTIAGSFPTEFIQDGSALGFTMMLRNSMRDGFHTFGTFKYSLHEDLEDAVLADVHGPLKSGDNWIYPSLYNDENTRHAPISCVIDTGSLGFAPAHFKRIRRMGLTLSELVDEELLYYFVPIMDNLSYQNRVEPSIEVEEGVPIPVYNEQINSLEFSEILPTIGPKVNDQNIFKAVTRGMQSRKRLELVCFVNMSGKVPRLRFYLMAKDYLKIEHYNIVYRQKIAR